MKRSVKHIASILALSLLGACASVGVKSDLATDCTAQAGAIRQATAMVAKLYSYERDAIDAQIALGKVYCGPGAVLTGDPGASKVVQSSTVQIGAILGVAVLRK